jgi:iron-sulfur cluster repair protein YtfE (RIC family)
MLFPLLEVQTEMKPAGPTRVMRKEHRRIEAMLGRLSRLVATPQCAAILQGFESGPDELSVLLANHDSKEEAILYPFMTRVLNPVEKRELLSAVQAFEI